MREIVYSSNIDISLGKGPSVNELEFIDALVKCRGVKPVVIIPKPRYALRSELEHEINFATTFAINGRNVFHLMLWEFVFLFNILKIKKRDALFIFRVSLFPIGLLFCCKFISGRYHLKTIGDGSFRYMRKLPFGEKLIRLNQSIFRVLVKHAHSVDMVTEKHRSDFTARLGYSEKCFVVDNKVNINFFHPSRNKVAQRKEFGLAQFDYLVGYVGNDPFNRGAMELVQAVRLIRLNEGLNVGAVIVGGMKDEETQEIIKFADSDFINILGQLPYTAVPEVMSCLDVGVSFLPQWHRGASEQKVRQYLACGVVPVVTPGGSEFVGKQGVGYVVGNENIADVANVIHSALLNIDNMTAGCRKYAELYLSHEKLASDRLEILCRSQS